MSKHKPKKSLISILMAVYEPRMDWLREQLLSLDAQTYPNLRLYIRDDCSPNVPIQEIEACVRASVHTFPFELRRNEANLGSNGTFERLTREAEGDYFAYCDQDDIWLPEKLEVLQAAMAAEGALLVCSDMFIIDGEGRQTADSITKVRRHHVFKSGEGLAPGLMIRNFATGCTMLVDARAAREAVPFCPYMVHDHYLALWCAAKGKIVSLPDRLIRYRIHADNQTPIMAGVTDKRSYVDERIHRRIERFRWLRERFGNDKALSAVIDRYLEWTEARERYFNGQPGAARVIWRLRRLSLPTSVFEIAMAGIPDRVFMIFVNLLKRNTI